MRHLILEGPDGTGKTTLAAVLRAGGGFDYSHEGPPPSTTTALRHYAGRLAGLSQPTVLDRFHLGEMVYGPIVRGGSRLSPYALKLLNRVVTGFGIRVVLCLPDYDTAVTNWSRRNDVGGEFLKDRMDFARSFQAFEDFRAVVSNVYDYTHPYADLQALSYLSPLPCCAPGVIGSPAASYLFVGERSNEPFDLPFMGERGASVFLNQALEHAGFREAEIAFTNALDQRGNAVNLAQRVSSNQRVVALGRVAETELAGQGITVDDALPHPQYWARFHARASSDYVSKLRTLKRSAVVCQTKNSLCA